MKKGLQIDGSDNVVIALEAVEAGEELVFAAGQSVTVLEEIGANHKVALCALKQGEEIRKYGFPIGYATKDIAAGQHVHVHNLDSEQLMQK